MNLLFYTPFNARSRDTESLMEAFVKQGHRVLLLTQAEWGPYHEHCEKMGVEIHIYSILKKSPLLYILRHTWHLFMFCRKYRPAIVYAHLETASLPAVLTQPFIGAKVFACRHIIDEAHLSGNRNFILICKIVYRLARNIIVVSQHCKNFMIEKEKVASHKIRVIRLGYNFKLYKDPDEAEVNRIRSSYPCQLLLLTACRMVGPKRPEYAVQIAQKLREKKLDVKLLLLGQGPDMDKLKARIMEAGLVEFVFLLGFKDNIMDYLSACDVLVHPSILDSSSVIIKEAGLRERLVVACHGIGDVDEYLIDGQHALLTSKENAVEEMTNCLADVYADRALIPKLGKALNEVVIKQFSILEILPEYDEIHQLNN